MSVDQTSFPTVAELRRLVKKRERERFSAMWFLEPIQAYFSYVLIRLGLNSIQVTVLWFAVAFAGYGVTCIGTPWAFIGGALLLYLKTILDGCDGEVARYRKQFISPEQDLIEFVHGVYLDKAFHIIEKPLWGLSLGVGVYNMNGEPWILAAGVSYAVFLGFNRHNATLVRDIPRQFAERVATFRESVELKTEISKNQRRDTIPGRVMDKMHLWMRNGKKFNLLVLCCSIADTILLWRGGPTLALFVLLCAAGVLSPVMMGYVIVRTIRSRSLIVRAANF